ncbi:MAG: amidophosphoribosyltransferase [Candidatus Marinimicrobia bacterium]|jgi:amidophosphoribosyltransferase|nr:amidophosphoribosyltransferase [Candidatus Neomarinimicrobiota bacterium]|tara:strand:+ start:1024 stop:2502 length:1479 start_codon:yes stop_codon:yes gene_type:complete
MCGIAGIFSHKPVAAELYDSIIHLQHRGQDAAGIMTYDDRMHKEKGVGLAKEIFNNENMKLLTGNIGISHNRYPTHGGFSHGEVQPFWTSVPYGIALAHNGNLTNYKELASEVIKTETRYLNTTSDSEVLLHLFADGLHRDVPPQTNEEFFELLCEAVENIFNKVRGAYSVTSIIIGKGLVVFRDPQGIRPLVKGQRPNGNGGKDYIFASENTMFYAMGYEPAGTVLPGELIYVDESGQVFSKRLIKKTFNPCIFEYVYFARPDATLNDVSVYRARLRMGQNLAEAWQKKHPDKTPDIVIPAPSTANTAALSFAHELGVRYSEGLYKNTFIGRTFIMPGQAERKKSVKYKLVPQELEIRDKKVMIMDDSIVRGNTSREIVRMLKDFGANEVYFAVACPPVKSPCFYGVDMPTRGELIAGNMNVDEIKSYLNVDALLYQKIDDLAEAVTRRGDHHIDRPCMACLDGNYVVNDIDGAKMDEMETMRVNDRNGND